jgi:hypothetical protein
VEDSQVDDEVDEDEEEVGNYSVFFHLILIKLNV